MAPLDVDEPHLEMGESGEGGGQAGHGPAGELGAATAGPTSWAGKLGTTPPPRSTASVIYEEGRKKRDSGGGDSWRRLRSRSVAADKLGRRR